MENKFAEAGIELLNKYSKSSAYTTNYAVVVIWESPLGTVEHRSGAFEEFEEANMFASMLTKQYKKLGYKFAVYVNGSLYSTLDWDCGLVE